MTSHSLHSAESRWRAQVAAVRTALAELKLSKKQQHQEIDIQFDQQDLSLCGRGRDVWDFVSDDEEERAAAARASGPPAGAGGSGGRDQRDAAWLAAKCSEAAAASGMAADVLVGRVRDLLSSKGGEAELQSQLIDLVGFDYFDLVVELLGSRDAIVASLSAEEGNPPPPGPSAGPAVPPRLLSRAERERALRRKDLAHKNTRLDPESSREIRYPHVYQAYHAGNTLSHAGKKYGLPLGSERREFDKYEEYYVPPGKPGRLAPGQSLIRITDLDGLCRSTFKGYETLNRMQSLVYPVAYRTNENMLICAPTGAGKTDAAMLTILNCIGRYATPNPLRDPGAEDFEVATHDFKIVYVAPMKALAAEVTEKLGRRLAWLNVRCREYTGDMQLTKAEILQTQIIVTTPEKWDVVTRKGTGDTELVQKVRLLIIDEVHMLHDERGAVLESLVARTQRQVESTQSLIRIVGLSATLPNYVDVADFLRVNLHAGLFYFDGSFRPVPLEQRFIGVKGKPNSRISRDNIDQVAFEKVREMLEVGHQVMVFVHSRRDTMLTCNMLHQKAVEAGCAELFDPEGHPRYDQAARDMRSSRSKEIRALLSKGLAIHHAGMARADRNLTERLFGDGVVKVLCCTATLAWGVNLPAAAVVIKGTQVYNAHAGKFVDLGILDVLQIFGRAGRPQFEDVGIGMICTTHDKLAHYLSAVTDQQPIESRFSSKMVDNLNAEVALGTVTSIQEAVQWLGYSYMFVRMRRNHTAYGIEYAEFRDDPQLVQRRRKLATDAARTLQQCQMVVFNERTGELRSKDIGRIASQFYILHTSIRFFNATMQPQATEADVLHMISKSGEFDNVQSRDSEAKELTHLRREVIPCDVAGGIDQPHTKTNILLQGYISRVQLEDFALANDLNYVAQQAGRICRALFMLALNRRWGHQCLVLLTLAKSIEKRIWPFQHPLHQFDLPRPVLEKLDSKENLGIEVLRDMDAREIGDAVQNFAAGKTIARLMRNFPTVTVDAETAPLNRDVLRVRLRISPDFEWNDRTNGASESYYVWVENSDSSGIYHHEFFILSRRKLHDPHELHFTIPLADPLPTQIYVRAVSDRWLGAESVTPVSFQHLIRPDTETVYTQLLNLQPLPVSALADPALEAVYRPRFTFFNPMQTQIFHTLYRTPANVLLGSPTGSGKTVAAELAMWWARRERPGGKVVYIAPMKALVRERVRDWTDRLSGPLGLRVVELTGDNTPDTRTIRDADVIITTPEKWDGISRSWQTRGYVRNVSLVIIDEIHLLAGDRGPILEIIVSRMNYISSSTKQPVRLLGMSTACANASDLASWLGVGSSALFNFRHSVRPVPLELYIDGFPEVRGFCPLMQSMNRPTFLAIKNHSPDKPVIVFVPSRRQTRLTAKDLINFCGIEDNPRRFLHLPDDSDEDGLQEMLARARDDALREALNFGIGLHHAGLVESDRQLAEELFLAGRIQILVATSTLAWGVNLPAHLVVVKGTQFYDAKTEAYRDMDLTDVLQMLGRAGRPQFDSTGVARIFTQEAKKDFYKHFLHTGFPVESSLHKVLDNHLCAEVAAGTIKSKQDALDYLTCTFFFRRIHKNPSYYDLDIPLPEQEASVAAHSAEAQRLANAYMVRLVDGALAELAESRCVEALPNDDVAPTPFGRIMSYYYLSHLTVRSVVRAATATSGTVSFADVLAWMSRATEYDELPVRHNEDLVNAELSRALPLPATAFGLPMWDPHVKAFLLLQAHMSRLELPVADYVGDQTSVLDQAIRVAQACIDVLAELGQLASCLEMVRLLQCIKSARWPTDAPVSILPGVRPDAAVESKPGQRQQPMPPSLLEIAKHSRPQLEALARKLAVPASAHQRFVAAALSMPHVDVDVKAAPDPASPGRRLTVVLRRVNALGQRDARAHTPRFPKAQTEGWFVIVGTQDEVLAVKRVGWSGAGGRKPDGKSRPEARAVVSLDGWAGDTADVWVVSDVYPGVEMKIAGVHVGKLE